MIFHTIAFLFSFTFLSQTSAVEVIDPCREAQQYLGADLVIVGHAVSCTTKIIQEMAAPEDTGWIWHQGAYEDIYRVRVDRVLRGSLLDSVLVIICDRTVSYSSKFLKVNEKGDSLFAIKKFADEREGIPCEVHGQGKVVLFLMGIDGRYMLRRWHRP